MITMTQDTESGRILVGLVKLLAAEGCTEAEIDRIELVTADLLRAGIFEDALSAHTVGREVQFYENVEHPRVLGTVSRIWPNGKYVSVISDGRTFVRDIRTVQVCS